jgi:hypothetical protein
MDLAGLHILVGHHVFGHLQLPHRRRLGLAFGHRLDIGSHRIDVRLVTVHLCAFMGERD